MKKHVAPLALALLLALVASSATVTYASLPRQTTDPDPMMYFPVISKSSNVVCRFGIVGLRGTPGYDRSLIDARAGAFIDWDNNPDRALPGVAYLRIISARSPFSDTTAANNAANLATAHPQSYWQVGNEPDTCYQDQDCTTAAEYGHRYRVIAQAIRQADSLAKIAFGSVVQPTPVRMRFLELAFNQLASEVGGTTQASALIDFWSIHGFILNEQPNEWGTGVPKDYTPVLYPGVSPVRITNFADTYSISIFSQRIRDFRNWMKAKGQQTKALWITEYGSLFPPIDQPGGPNHVNVTDQITSNYMVSTFNYLRATTDASTGMPGDGNRLVQRWFWYSLNDHRYTFGGTLFDPDNGSATTLVGQTWLNYVAPLPIETYCLP